MGQQFKNLMGKDWEREEGVRLEKERRDLGERQRRLSHRGGKERSLEDKVGEGNQVMMRKGRRGLSGERCHTF